MKSDHLLTNLALDHALLARLQGLEPFVAAEVVKTLDELDFEAPECRARFSELCKRLKDIGDRSRTVPGSDGSAEAMVARLRDLSFRRKVLSKLNDTAEKAVTGGVLSHPTADGGYFGHIPHQHRNGLGAQGARTRTEFRRG